MPIFGFLYPLSEFVAWYVFIDRYSFFDAFLLCLSTGVVGLFIVSLHAKALLTEVTLAAPRAQASGGDFRKLLSLKSLHRLLIMAGGLFLFAPGLVAKVVGTFLILPGARHLALWILQAKFAEGVVKSGFQVFVNSQVWGSRDMRDVVEITPTSIEHKSITENDPNSR